jgi:hypothetical protein
LEVNTHPTTAPSAHNVPSGHTTHPRPNLSLCNQACIGQPAPAAAVLRKYGRHATSSAKTRVAHVHPGCSGCARERSGRSLAQTRPPRMPAHFCKFTMAATLRHSNRAPRANTQRLCAGVRLGWRSADRRRLERQANSKLSRQDHLRTFGMEGPCGGSCPANRTAHQREGTHSRPGPRQGEGPHVEGKCFLPKMVRGVRMHGPPAEG